MEPIAFVTNLTARDVMRVTTTLLLRHALSIMAMAAGPVFWLVGISGSSHQVIELGRSLTPLVAAVPALALLSGSFAAYRPGASALYQPVEWRFADDEIDLGHSGGRARAQWSEFRFWRRTGDYFLLYTSRSRYIILPVRDIGPDRSAALEDLLSQRLGAKHR